MVKAAAAGDPELAKKVGSFHGQLEQMVVAALRGEAPAAVGQGRAPTAVEQRLADLLSSFWFGALVGWNNGRHGQAAVMERMAECARMLVHGAGYEEPR